MLPENVSTFSTLKPVLLVVFVASTLLFASPGEAKAFSAGIGGAPVSISVSGSDTYTPGQTIAVSFVGNNSGAWRYVYMYLSVNGVSFDVNQYFNGNQPGPTYGTWYLVAPSVPGNYAIYIGSPSPENISSSFPITVACASGTTWNGSTCATPLPPTASFTIDGAQSETIAVGQSNTKAWSSANGTSWSSTYSMSDSGSGTCTRTGQTGAWNANNANGSETDIANSANAGCTAAITYTVSNSAGSASATIYVSVAPIPPPVAWISQDINPTTSNGSQALGGQAFTVSWGVSSGSATSCTVNHQTPDGSWTNGWGSSGGTGGSQTASPGWPGGHAWSVSCTGSGGTSNTASFSHTVNCPNGGFANGTSCAYTVSASAGSGGSISPSGGTTVNYGGSQAYLISPSAGYAISSVSVDGVNQGAVSGYTFSNVTAGHSIVASFAPTSSVTASLTIDGQRSETLPVGQYNTKTWSSTGGTAWSSVFSVDNGTCASAGQTNLPWSGGNTANGSISNFAQPIYAGCTVTITYTATGSSGSASDSINLTVLPPTISPSSYSVTLPSNTVTAHYATGTNTNVSCQLLDNNGNPLTQYSPCNGSLLVTTPKAPGTYGYYMRVYQSSNGPQTVVSNGFTVTVGNAASSDYFSTAPTCTVSAGLSYCSNSTASWNISNPTNPLLYISTYASSFSVGPSASNTYVRVDYPQTTLILYNGATEIGRQTVTAVCASGTSWNGSSCGASASCTLPWGSTLASGQSVTAFQTGAVVSPASCSSVPSETRTCTGGVLSGSYQYANCSVLNPTATISANPTRVRPGKASTITWSASDVKSCSVSGPGLSSAATSGSQSPAVTTRSVYTITCQTLSSPITATAIVNVVPLFQEF